MLASGERRVSDLVGLLALPQPQVPKHLRSLREVGLVRARETMNVLIQCPSAEIRNAIVESGMEAGMQDAYDPLEEVAQSLA